MSEENVDVVRRCLGAYAAGDNEAALAAFDPDVVFDQRLRPDGGIFHGPQGIAEAMRTWTGAFEEWRLEVEEIIDAGDRVLVIATQFGRGKGSGVETEQRDFSLYTVRNGKIVHLTSFLDRREAFEAAGLSE